MSVHATVDGDVEVNYSPQNPWASKIEFALHKGQSHLQVNRTFQPRVGHLAVFTAIIIEDVFVLVELGASPQ